MPQPIDDYTPIEFDHHGGGKLIIYRQHIIAVEQHMPDDTTTYVVDTTERHWRVNHSYADTVTLIANGDY